MKGKTFSRKTLGQETDDALTVLDYRLILFIEKLKTQNAVIVYPIE
jgi:hypothetical protein